MRAAATALVRTIANAGDLQSVVHRIKATLIKWRNRHDICLRADCGELAQMHLPCFKPAQ